MENDACTTSITGAARLVQLLKINGFSATETMGQDYVRSRWNVGDYEWEIRVYPAALLRDPFLRDPFNEVRLVVVELVFLSESRTSGSSAALCCQLIDPTGKVEPSHEQTVTRKFHQPQDLSGQVRLMRRGEVIASGYLKDDTLTVRCTITVLEELPVATIPAKEVIAPPSTNLHQHLGKLLKDQTGADVRFIVSGKSFAAHKLILAARSPVFMAEFFGEIKEKCLEPLKVKDMDAAVFKAMLHFIYTDTVPELDQRLEEVATMAQHLLAAADRYGLDRLKLICESMLSGGISVDTAAITFALAEQHNCSELKARCAAFIVSTPAILDAVLATEGYKHLAASCPSVLADLLKSSLLMGGRTNA